MTTPNKDLDPRIEGDLLDLLYKQSRTAVFASIVVGSLLAVALYGAVDASLLFGWLTLLYGMSLMRFVHGRRYARRSGIATDTRFWSRSFIALVGLSGCLWGVMGGFIAPGDSPIHLAAAIAVLLGMVSGAQASPSVFLIFAVPALAPIAVRLLLLGHTAYLVMGVLILFFLGAALSYRQPRYLGLVESLNLRYENLDLVGELRKQKSAAEQANTDKSRFLAAASHDLRQPLHSLELFFESLRHEPHSENGRYLVERMGVGLGTLRSLFDELLDVSRLDAGVIQPRPAHFPLADLLAALETEFQVMAGRSGRDLRRDGVAPTVYTDRVLLERVLRNLLSNALRHGEGRIDIETRVANDGVWIAIRDQGPGIPEPELENIFSEFHQLEDHEREPDKGIGLGLAIARRVAGLLDHPLSVISAPGEGAEFSILVPLGDPALEAEADRDAGEHAWDLSASRILVIDDDRDIRRAMQGLLEGWGCRVWCAEGEVEARGILAGGARPDLVLCDYRLRNNASGLEVLSRLERELGEVLPAIIITGDTSAERLREAHDSGIILLHKPLRPAKLRMGMMHVLKQASAG